MSTIYKIRQFFYSLIFNSLEFVFFFTHYWWWKFQWALVARYWRMSGYQIYRNERHLTEGLEEENFSFDETTALSTRLLLQEISPQKGSLVYDLGSGRGTFLMAAYFLHDLRGVGVELFPTYIEKSRAIQKVMKVGSISYKQGNITEIDVSEADIVYLAGATFQEEVLNKVKENLKALRPDSIVISIRQQLPEEDFVIFNEGNYPFSWGADHVYFYRRK